MAKENKSSPTIFVGVDISKKSLDVALTRDGEAFTLLKPLSNDKSGFCRLLMQLKDLSSNEADFHICFESTGIYSVPLAHFLDKNSESKWSLVNPMQVKSFRKASLIRTKTDTVDAKAIASFALKTEPRQTVLKDSSLIELRAYCHQKDFLISQKTQYLNQLESVRIPSLIQSSNTLIRAIDRQISKIEASIDQLIESHDDIGTDIALLESISGIGKQTATMLLTELLEETDTRPKRYSRRRQIAHSGLSPSQYQSGTSVNRKPRISRMGNKKLRTALYLPTISAIRSNPVIKQHYQQLKSRGKPPKVAIVACMKKLLGIAIGILNNQVPFDANWVSTPHYAAA